MSRKIPGSKRKAAARPSRAARERFFDGLNRPYSTSTFEPPDPHPAMDRPSWRHFRGFGRQTRRDWIVAVVFLVVVIGPIAVLALLEVV